MQWIRLLWIALLALCILEAKIVRSASSSSAPAPPRSEQQEQHFHVRSDSLLLLCTDDGSIFVLNAWTGKLISRSLTGIPLLTRTVSSRGSTVDLHQDGGEDSAMLVNHIVPGVDGKLYWRDNDVDDAKGGGDNDDDLELQPLPLSIPSLLQHPVRTCSDANKNACGILHAVEHTVLYGLDPQSGILQWSTGGLFGWNSEQEDLDSSADTSYLILQRKDVSIQQVSSRNGQQLWNITMGSYQAVDFDGGSTGNPSGSSSSSLLDDDDDLDNNETPVVSLLPSLAFLQGGRQLVAVSHDANGLSESYGPILWRIETPSRVASIFGIMDSKWHPIHILDAFYEHYGNPKQTPLLLADTPHRDGKQHFPNAWMIEEMYRLHHEQFGKTDFFRPPVRGLLPAPDDDIMVKVVARPEYSFEMPHIPVITVIQPNGLVLSWEFVNTIILSVAMLIFAIVVIYRRQKQLLRRAQLRVNLAESARRNPPKESQSLPGNSRKGSVGKALQSDPGELNIFPDPEPAALVKTSGSTNSEENVQQGVIQQGGIPLVRYARFHSEFSQSHALGKGGFGSVFQCRNNLDGREYAIKKVRIRRKREDDSSFNQRLQRVLREVKILAMLDHPNIVRYYTAWLEVEDGVEEETDRPDESASQDFSSSFLTNHTTSEWGKSRSNIGRFRHHWSVDSDSASSDIFLPRVPTKRSPAVGDDLGFIFEASDEQDGRGATATEAANAASRHEEQNESKSPTNDDSPVVVCPIADKSTFVAPESALTGNENELSIRHTLYIQMQLCSFNNLSDFVADPYARKGSLSSGIDVALALRLFLQIAQAVQYVHNKGLIHRDLKPTNCFVDDTGKIKVGDFGLSRESNDKDSEAVIETPAARARDDDQTAGVGTRLYASPEQSAGSTYDSSTDVYSLGIILFELCYPMYTGMERNICISRLRDKHDFPKDWDTVVSSSFPSLRELILSMLSHKPENRPTASSVAEHVQEVLGELTIISVDGGGTSSDGLVLLRVEADSEPDTLAHTMEQVRQAANPGTVDILQYGLSQTKDSHTIMEFALRASSDVVAALLVSRLKARPRILTARQVSASQ